MPDILHQLTIKASPQQVYAAITTQAGLSSWWTHDTKAEPKVGTVSEFGFLNRKIVFKMRVDVLQPNSCVSWYCLGGDPEWEDTSLSFELTRTPEGHTQIYFLHHDWKTTSGIFALCNFDWAKYLTSLRDYLETGKGNPHTK